MRVDEVMEKVRDAAEEVHSILGTGYNEDVYEEALAHELRIRKIPYERQRNFEVIYKGYTVGTARTDITVYPKWAAEKGEEFLLELKKTKEINDNHIKQAQVYLVSLNIPEGAVFAFGDENELKFKKVPPPQLKPRKVEVVAGIKKDKEDLKHLLQKISEEVMEYFGTYFIFSESKIEYYREAIGIELRLRNIQYDTVTKDIFYKNHLVSEHTYDFVLEDGTVLYIATYSHKKNEDIETGIKRAIDDEKRYFKLHGIKKGFFIGIPSSEGEKAVVREM